MTTKNLVSPRTTPLSRDGWFKKISSVRELGPLTLLVVLAVVFGILSPEFLSPMNISNMLAFIAELGIIALGVTLLMTAGEIDLSVGSVFGAIPVLMFVLYNDGILPFVAAFVVALVMAALVGLINGLLVTKFRISSFIVTIGMLLIVRGVAIYITSGSAQATYQTQSWIKAILIGQLAHIGEFNLGASLLWFLGLAVLAHLLLTSTRFGNWIQATGGNLRAAKGRAVNTDRVKIVLFVLCSVLACFAGIIDALRVQAAYPIGGEGYELEVIAMAVIGGNLLWGGRGTIPGTIIGILLLRAIRNGIIIIGVPGMAYNIFVGIIIIFMMVANSVLSRASTGD
jgi:simple sugar transport system permease protein